MLLSQDALREIREGRVSLVFRRWRRPTVRAGGTLMTSAGVLSIDSLEEVELDDVTDADAAAAGYEGRGALVAALRRRREGTVYRIGVSYAGPDPRAELRRTEPDDEEVDRLIDRLKRMDPDAPGRGWPLEYLELIGGRPAVRAADLAEQARCPRDRFKRRVRRLKALGLTESLEIGYRLSPRGEALLRDAD